MRNLSVRTIGRTMLLAGLVAAVAGCSWIRGSDDKAAGKTSAKPVPGADKNYPNLSTVPAKRPEGGTPRQRQRIIEGLTADRQNARYIDGGPVAGKPNAATGGDAKVKTQVFTPGTFVARTNTNRGARAAGRPAPPRPALRIRGGGYVATITFPNGSTGLPDGSGRTVVQVAELYRWSGGTKILVVGHSVTDKGVDAAAKRNRSIARANVVAQGLINLGVPRAQIGLAVLSDTRPRFKDAARDGQNSRVDIFIQGAKRR